MTRSHSSLRRRAMVSGGLALLAAVGLAAPAMAHATVSIMSPGAGEQIGDVNRATIQAAVSPDSGTAIVGKVRLRVQQLGSKRPDITADDTASAGGATFQDVPIPYNGAYRATVAADWKHTVLLGSHNDTATSAPVDVLVAVPPASPVGVRTAVDGGARSVTVTWKANPEPDMLFYVVQRAKGTSGDFTVLGKVTKGTETTFADASTADAGGDYRYQVVAVRSSGLADDKGLSSDPSAISADSTAKVPDPPPPPTVPVAVVTPGAPGAGAPGAAGTPASVPANSPGALATSGSVDLSGFNTVRTQTRPATPRVLELPDPGFQGTLPFATPSTTAGSDGTAEAGDVGQVAIDSPQSRELGADSSTDRIRTMAFFAAGLLSTVLLMHLLWVKSEVKRVPLEAVDPEGLFPVGAALDDAPAKAVRSKGSRRARGRHAWPGGADSDNLADLKPEEVDAADFAPVVVAAHGKGDRGRLNGNRRQKVSTGA